MRRGGISAALTSVAAVVIASACHPADAAKVRADSAELAKREQRLEQSLAQASPALDTTAIDSVARDSTATPDTVVQAESADDQGKQKDKKGNKEKKDKNDKKDKQDKDDTDAAPDDGAIARWIMPRALDELSGITLTSDGRLLAHGDERAQVSEIDYRRGVVLKQFVVGNPTIKADLEGIATANGNVFLLASNGTLYEFREGGNGQRVDYITSDTRLGKECEFEGLAFDASINSLLLACKNVELKNQKDSLLIYRWKLQGGSDRLTKLTVPLRSILPAIGEKDLHPSDITVDPKSGNYVIIASIEKAMVEITPSGEVVFARKLIGHHDQPEAVAITKDGILIIGDEAGRRPAVITLYRWSQ
ncbi:MAG TPA: SdiA-regulated domain-containing protein [Gemmatimonadaceae bacterium]|nr:SdiA-regulated domain-containing protein [Gemmatimonadaceae bacterium]